MNDQPSMKELQDEFSKSLDDAQTIARKMLEVARGDEWTESAYHDFDSIKSKLEQVAGIFGCTPNKPDADGLFDDEEDDR